MPLIERTPGPLPPGHRCRVDDLAYTSVSDWFTDHRGRVPIQAAAGLDRYIRAKGCTFAEAFAALSGKGGPIILLDDEATRDPEARPRAVGIPAVMAHNGRR